MFKDSYLQPDVPDPVLPDAVVLELVRRDVPGVQAITAVDESGGEARTYAIDRDIIVKVQRPHRVRPRTSLEKEVFFLRQLANNNPTIPVPRVLGYGRAGNVEYTIMSRMPGMALVRAHVQDRQRQNVLFTLGQTLRRIHQLPQAPFKNSLLFPGDRTAQHVQTRFTELVDVVAKRIQNKQLDLVLPLSPEALMERLLAVLSDTDESVGLHSNPGRTHTFVDPQRGVFTGVIDFGDAYISHPVFDLWRWPDPHDRAVLLAGYTAEQPVSEPFLVLWRIMQVLADLQTLTDVPEHAPAARMDLMQHLSAL